MPLYKCVYLSHTPLVLRSCLDFNYYVTFIKQMDGEMDQSKNKRNSNCERIREQFRNGRFILIQLLPKYPLIN